MQEYNNNIKVVTDLLLSRPCMECWTRCANAMACSTYLTPGLEARNCDTLALHTIVMFAKRATLRWRLPKPHSGHRCVACWEWGICELTPAWPRGWGLYSITPEKSVAWQLGGASTRSLLQSLLGTLVGLYSLTPVTLAWDCGGWRHLAHS